MTAEMNGEICVEFGQALILSVSDECSLPFSATKLVIAFAFAAES